MWRRNGVATTATPTAYDVRDSLRRASARIWSATSAADLLAVAGDLLALANAIGMAARRQQRIGRR
jgi:hypothetical protein